MKLIIDAAIDALTPALSPEELQPLLDAAKNRSEKATIPCWGQTALVRSEVLQAYKANRVSITPIPMPFATKEAAQIWFLYREVRVRTFSVTKLAELASTILTLSIREKEKTGKKMTASDIAELKKEIALVVKISVRTLNRFLMIMNSGRQDLIGPMLRGEASISATEDMLYKIKKQENKKSSSDSDEPLSLSGQENQPTPKRLGRQLKKDIQKIYEDMRITETPPEESLRGSFQESFGSDPSFLLPEFIQNVVREFEKIDACQDFSLSAPVRNRVLEDINALLLRFETLKIKLESREKYEH